MEWTLLQTIYWTRGAAQRKAHPAPPPVQQIVDELAIPPNIVGRWMYLLDNYNPQTVSAAHYMQRNVYHHPAQMDGEFGEMAAAGVLELTGDVDPIAAFYAVPDYPTSPRYRVTEKGYRLHQRVRELMRPRWIVPELEEINFSRLLDLLARVGTATLSTPTPPEHWAVDTRAAYGAKLTGDVPPLERLDFLTFDLWAYRDDTHLAAWRTPYPDLMPRAWEALTVFWRGNATDADSLAKALEIHGFSAAYYVDALAELTRRGWVAADAGVYRLTDAGRDVRQTVEDTTNQTFYAPWDAALSTAERTELSTLLETLCDKIKSLSEG